MTLVFGKEKGRILNGIEKQITPKEMKEELIQVWKAL